MSGNESQRFGEAGMSPENENLVVCSWCRREYNKKSGESTGKIVTIKDDERLAAEGKFTSHGICPDCEEENFPKKEK